MNEWINVNNKLPELEGRYLVSITSILILTSWFYADVPEPHFDLYGVEYWMNLPENPIKESL